MFTMARLGYLIIFLISSFVKWTCSFAEMTPENRLWNDLTKNYNRNIRPVKDPNKVMTVNVTFSLKKIESLDEKNQIMNSFGWMAMSWTDEILQWNPMQYNYTYRIVVGADEIWLPEVAMLNSVDQGNDLSLDVKFRAAVWFNGMVIFAPGFKWRTECKVDLMDFPFDTQACNVSFVNWVYTGSSVVYNAQAVVLDMFDENDEWSLINATANSLVNVLGEVEENFLLPEMYFTVNLKRNPMYYIINVVVPCFMISVLSCLVFLLPSDSGEKISMAITVMLSYTVILLMVSDITPRGGVTMPYITLFIIINMAETALSLIISVMILNVYHHHGNNRVPKWLRRFAFDILATVVCLRESTRKAKVTPVSDDSKWAQKLHSRVVQEDDSNANKHSSMNSLPDDVVTYIRMLMVKEDEKEEEENNKAEWVALGKILDKVMLYVFALFILVSITCFLVVTTR